MDQKRHLLRLLSNNKKNYLFLSLVYIDLTRGLWMIWLAVQGFSLTQLGIMEGVFHLTSFLMEVPTGIIADLFGRKTSRLIGRILFLGSIVILYLSRSLTFQCFGFALSAIGYNLESGAGEALIYDSLKELGKENQYKKFAGFNNLIFEIGSVISLIAGGYFAHKFGFHWVFIPGFTVCLLSILVASLFEEPSITYKEQRRLRQLGWKKALVEQIQKSTQVIFKKPQIFFIIFYTELVMMFIASLYFYLQIYWRTLEYNVFQIGGFLAIASVSSALAGILAERIEKILSLKGIILSFPLLLVFSLWGIGLSDFSVFFFAITGFIDGVLYVAVQDYLNKRIPSERRATILSFQSMAFSIFMITGFPLIGFIGERYSLQFAFLIMAGIASLFYVVFLIISGRKLSL